MRWSVLSSRGIGGRTPSPGSVLFGLLFGGAGEIQFQQVGQQVIVGDFKIPAVGSEDGCVEFPMNHGGSSYCEWISATTTFCLRLLTGFLFACGFLVGSLFACSFLFVWLCAAGDIPA